MERMIVNCRRLSRGLQKWSLRTVEVPGGALIVFVNQPEFVAALPSCAKSKAHTAPGRPGRSTGP